MGWFHDELYISEQYKEKCKLCNKNIAIFGIDKLEYCGKCCNTKKKSGREINVTALYLGKYYVRTWWIDIFRDLYKKDKKIMCHMLDNCENKNDLEEANFMMNGYLKNQKVNPFKEFIIENYLTCGTINAVIVIPNDIENLYNSLKKETRRMIRKAIKNEYSCREFNWNDYLDDINEIHRSKDTRCGKTLNKSLLKYPEKKKIYRGKYHFHLYFGVFKDNELVGYTNIRCHNDTAIVTRFLGHGNHITYGIMNLLVHDTVKLFIEKYNFIKYFIYCEYNDSQSKSLLNFKKYNGFKPYITYFRY